MLFFGSRYSIVIMRRYIKVIPIAIIPISFGIDSPVESISDSCHTYTDVTYPIISCFWSLPFAEVHTQAMLMKHVQIKVIWADAEIVAVKYVEHKCQLQAAQTHIIPNACCPDHPHHERPERS